MRVLEASDSPRAWTMSGERVALAIDPGVYPLEVVLRAAYGITGRAFVFVHTTQDELGVVLRSKDGTVAVQDLVGEFANALIDHAIRRQLASEFRDVHAAIVHEAFAPVRGRQ